MTADGVMSPAKMGTLYSGHVNLRTTFQWQIYGHVGHVMEPTLGSL